MKKIVFISLILGTFAFASDNYGYEKNSYIDIMDKNIKQDQDITYFDRKNGGYHNANVRDIQKGFDGRDEIKVYDPNSNSYRTFEK